MVKSLLKAFGVVAIAAVIAGAYVFWPVLASLIRPVPHTAAVNAPAPTRPDAMEQVLARNVQFAPVLMLDLPAAIDQDLVQAEFKGNGREKMRMVVTYKGEQHVRLHVPAGLIFQNGMGSVVLLRARDFDLKPGAIKQEELQTAAIGSANQIVDAAYSLTLSSEPKLDALLAYLPQHSEIPRGAVQTAVLALTENLPLGAFAKFAEAGGDLPSRYDTTAFKVETSDIVSALIALREIGVPDGRLALTIDPQLKIEAMIDPLAHASAMRYYGITPKNEWEFWKRHLLQGEESTRHYALYGIARFYPEVALQMLPAWARETRVNPVYRLSAVQALAETERLEAVSVLRQLEHEFGMLTDIGRAAHTAAGVLDARLNKTSVSKIAFRGNQNVPAL